MIRKIETRGLKYGQCNICGEVADLTEDHTPPKGSVRITQVELNHVVNLVKAEKPGTRGRILQNGIKFRTLCARCNNKILGAKYDIEFINFTNKISSYLRSGFVLPRIMSVKAKPHMIARAVIGHLSAIGVNRYFKGPNTENLKNWFLDENAEFPNFLDILYWLYPYKTQVLIRDAALRNLQVEDTASIWLMKFYPISFLVVWNNPVGYDYHQFPRFSRWKDCAPDMEVEMPVYLNTIPHERWPEFPEDHSFLVYGEGAIGAVEKKRKKTYGGLRYANPPYEEWILIKANKKYYLL